ncbi:universal stress protein [Bacillus sp. FSL W8-0102]|uniref:universal stress protein n=1 Tax=Bacillus sp. FSL W8-0102 TaxID=2978205 RepID=UPI0030FA059C
MDTQYKHILVAVDGSQEAEWAFKKSIEIAKRNEATIYLVHVIDTRVFAGVEAYDYTITAQAEKYGQELLEDYKKKAEKAGVKNIVTFLEHGSPKAVIPRDVAKKVEADLIICGATGMNAVERFLIGSVSEHIARSSRCDVLIVRTNKS